MAIKHTGTSALQQLISLIKTALAGKRDVVVQGTITDGGTIALPVGESEWRASASVSTLTVSAPASGTYEAWLRFTTGTGAPSITLPAGMTYVNEVPAFGASQTWEISIKDGVAIAVQI